MGHFSTISSKGQVTVQQQIRKRLGLEAGDRVEFVVEDERTVIRPARSKENPFQKYFGILGRFPGEKKGSKRGLTICVAIKTTNEDRS